MTLASLPASPDEGGTAGRSRPARATGLGNAARALRYEPPTPEEVGRAAAVCVQDTLSDEQIAGQLGIARRTLARWKKRPDFAVALAALQAWQELTRETATIAEASRSAPSE